MIITLNDLTKALLAINRELDSLEEDLDIDSTIEELESEIYYLRDKLSDKELELDEARERKAQFRAEDMVSEITKRKKELEEEKRIILQELKNPLVIKIDKI